MRTTTVGLLVLWIGLIFLPMLVQAQGPQETQELNIRTYIELLRSNLRANQSTAVAKAMQLSEEDAAKFWPIYREYERESMRLGDIRLKIIEDYTTSYETLSDPVADSLMKRVLDLEARRVALKRKYYRKFKAALTPILAARFFQIEHQIQLLIDLQIAANLPLLTKQQETH